MNANAPPAVPKRKNTRRETGRSRKGWYVLHALRKYARTNASLHCDSSRECRTRRIKCDESKPSCAQCRQGARSCSILDTAFKFSPYTFRVSEVSNTSSVQKEGYQEDAEDADGVHAAKVQAVTNEKQGSASLSVAGLEPSDRGTGPHADAGPIATALWGCNQDKRGRQPDSDALEGNRPSQLYPFSRAPSGPGEFSASIEDVCDLDDTSSAQVLQQSSPQPSSNSVVHRAEDQSTRGIAPSFRSKVAGNSCPH
jgi:hypothetical protein